MDKSPDDKENPGNGFSMPVARNVSVWLDSYDDIFSDFDPRPFQERNISDDFLFETKKFFREKESPVSGFTLLIPENMREKEKEVVIIKRLNHFFKKNYLNISSEVKKENRKALVLTISGVIMTIIAGYVSFHQSDNFLMHTLFVLFEPAGWFMLWIGLESLLHYSKKEKRDLSFYKRMSVSKINFHGY